MKLSHRVLYLVFFTVLFYSCNQSDFIGKNELLLPSHGSIKSDPNIYGKGSRDIKDIKLILIGDSTLLRSKETQDCLAQTQKIYEQTLKNYLDRSPFLHNEFDLSTFHFTAISYLEEFDEKGVKFSKNIMKDILDKDLRLDDYYVNPSSLRADFSKIKNLKYQLGKYTNHHQNLDDEIVIYCFLVDKSNNLFSETGSSINGVAKSWINRTVYNPGVLFAKVNDTYTLSHEIGHVLGLDHGNNPNYIMYKKGNKIRYKFDPINENRIALKLLKLLSY